MAGLSASLIGNHMGPSPLFYAIGQASSDIGPWIFDWDMIRVTIELKP
jgi:hypothetical protein